MSTTRRRAAAVLAVIGLAAFGLAGPAGAEKVTSASRPAEPADQITGQDHPADVAVFAWQYLPTTVHVKRGGSIKFGNYDMYPYGAGITAHSLTEAVPGCTEPPFKDCEDSYPRFSSALVDHGYVAKVEGVEKLPPGQYPFTCQMHQQMRGTLVIE